MPKDTARLLADQLLRENAHLGTFEVNVKDPLVNAYLVQELRRRGCRVEFESTSTKLQVWPPTEGQPT